MSMTRSAHVDHGFPAIAGFAFTRPTSALARGGLASWQQRRALELLESNLEARQSLATVAGACRLSGSHFRRCFRASLGVPVHQWLIQRRIARAKALLGDADLALGEVALVCGFSDQSHFTRTFRRLTGTTPRRWQTAMRAAASPAFTPPMRHGTTAPRPHAGPLSAASPGA